MKLKKMTKANARIINEAAMEALKQGAETYGIGKAARHGMAGCYSHRGKTCRPSKSHTKGRAAACKV